MVVFILIFMISDLKSGDSLWYTLGSCFLSMPPRCTQRVWAWRGEFEDYIIYQIEIEKSALPSLGVVLIFRFSWRSEVGAALLQAPLRYDTKRASTRDSLSWIQCGWWLNSSSHYVRQVPLGSIRFSFWKIGYGNRCFWGIELRLMCNIFSCLWLTLLCQNIMPYVTLFEITFDRCTTGTHLWWYPMWLRWKCGAKYLLSTPVLQPRTYPWFCHR